MSHESQMQHIATQPWFQAPNRNKGVFPQFLLADANFAEVIRSHEWLKPRGLWGPWGPLNLPWMLADESFLIVKKGMDNMALKTYNSMLEICGTHVNRSRMQAFCKIKQAQVITMFTSFPVGDLEQ